MTHFTRWQITGHQYCRWIFRMSSRMHRLSHSTLIRYHRSHSIKSVFLYFISRCLAVITLTLLLLLLLIFWEQWGLTTRGMHFRKLRLGEYTTPLKLVFMPVSAGGFALFTQQDIGQFRRGLDLCHKLCISSNKIRWKLQLCTFLTLLSLESKCIPYYHKSVSYAQYRVM